MPFLQRDPAVLAGFLEDAAHFPGGHAAGIVYPETEADVADVVRSASAVLPIGAQSSLTGGATPMGDVLLSTSRLNRILQIGPDSVRAQAGVTLVELDAALAAAGKYYPPAPTFMGAFVGGVVATNAAGAATFKYGTTRDWVLGLRVVLASGDAIEFARGEHRAASFVPVPTYRPPRIAKCSAGYFAAPDMDLVDLFVGSEGTLGIITEVTLRIVPDRPAQCLVFVTLDDREQALESVARLRRDAHRLGLSAIEHMDRRSLALLREDGIDRQFGVTIPADAGIALLITFELDQARAAAAADHVSGALCDAGIDGDADIALPGDRARIAQLIAVREAVPAAVNARVGRAKRSIDAGISKTAADMIVPFDRLGELMTLYDAEFTRRGLDAAVWGHISDGNLHPNVLPRSAADVASGLAAILNFGRAVIGMGGSPLAEHGVGRNPTKQRLLREMYGEAGIDEMRAVKRALDPGWKLAPGVLFPTS
ncbi:MAG TPA: FAD-binding oxidoreductase [Vicinamibacterales bacterium]|nr:FAD-binding oxidoreductase [Vicinamibacterales bacterium]